MEPLAFSQSFSAAPTGRGSGTLVALGMNCVITPHTTGRVLAICSGVVGNGTSTDGFAYNLYYGTTAAPTNNDAVSGTALFSSDMTVTSVVTSDLTTPFCCHGIITGAAADTVTAARKTGTPVPMWVDVMFKQVTGGTVTFTTVSLTLIEI
jgi:hypothetical protein